MDADSFIGEVELDLPTFGWQIPSASGPWRMDLRDLNIDYIDKDAPYTTLAQVGLLHVSMQNLSATTKVFSHFPAALAGAVADDGGVQTDETTEANNVAANDMTLLPALPVADDAYYFGSSIPFPILELNIGTAGVGTWTIVWEYYSPSTGWTALSSVVDGSNAFRVAGGVVIGFTLPYDWAQVAVAGITAYWIRARVSLFTAITTQPLGTQALVDQEGAVVLEFAYEPRS